MTPTKPKNGLQFSLRALMVIVTIACIVLAFPEGYVLLAAVTAWMLVGAAIIIVLMIFQAPIYRLLSGLKRKDKGGTLTTRSDLGDQK